MIELKLKPREERRLRAGHLWVYSNEIDTPPGFSGLEPGSLCRLFDHRGKPLGTGTLNPHALIAVRLLSGDVRARIDTDWFIRRLRSALALRERSHSTPHYRAVFGEGDGLPGLVVDRFGDRLVVQIATAGMERLKPQITEALVAVLSPRGIRFANDLPMRATEGLALADDHWGAPDDGLEVVEGPLRLEIPPSVVQKTGWFYDQRHNRDRFLPYLRGARVLDGFSYVGAWALRGLLAGAKSALCVDRSAEALAVAERAAAAQGLALATRCGEALDVFKALKAEGQRFDVVVNDPPALIKRRKDHPQGLEHYAALNRAAMQLLAEDGILIACSCSYHLEEAELERLLLREARRLDRRLAFIERGGQGPDHPVHPAIAETRYLKAIVARVY